MLAEEIEKCKGLQEMIKIKEESLASRANEIEALDKTQIDLTRTVEELKIKMDGLKRQNELSLKHLNEKVENQREILSNEKDTREMWVARYEKEQQEHTLTNSQLL